MIRTVPALMEIVRDLGYADSRCSGDQSGL